MLLLLARTGPTCYLPALRAVSNYRPCVMYVLTFQIIYMVLINWSYYSNNNHFTRRLLFPASIPLFKWEITICTQIVYIFHNCGEAKGILPEEQWSFRPARSTIDMLFDMLFVVRRLQELGRATKIPCTCASFLLLLFERSEFLIDTSQKKSLRVCTRAVCTCARVQ